MIKPVRWKTFPRDLLMIQLGFAIFGAAIALVIRAALGTGTWVVLEVALARIFGLSVGTITVMVGFAVLFLALAMREKVGWGTLANILSIGPWLDFFLWIIPSAARGLPVQVLFLLSGIFLQGIATAIYIGVEAGAGPRDSLMLALHRTTGLSIRFGRGVIEVIVLAAGWLLGGPVGLGTLVFALLIGPAIQWAFRLFKVQPHRPAATEAGAD